MEQKGKGHALAPPSNILRTGRPRKVPEEKDAPVPRCSGYGEPIPKHAREVSNPVLLPISLLVPDQDFGDFIGCQGAYFKCSLGEKVGHFNQCDKCQTAGAQCRSVCTGFTKCFRCTLHRQACLVNKKAHVNTVQQVFLPEPALVNEIRVLLARLHQDGHRINSHNWKHSLPFPHKPSRLHRFVDLEAKEAPSDEDPDAEEDQLVDDE
ncbi:hypothetical protein F5146DRAFT_1145387 [Armillaria mellea]|nr:hypothetical protein F5146DRAFT_1145387 [Armillaria mellea]